MALAASMLKRPFFSPSMFHDKQVLPAVAKAVATQVRHGEKWLRLEQKIGWEVWISLDLITPKVLFKRESKNCVIDMEAIAIRLEAIATRNKKKELSIGLFGCVLRFTRKPVQGSTLMAHCGDCPEFRRTYSTRPGRVLFGLFITS